MSKPNLLFVFSDQHRACDLGCYGNDQVHSPALDAFAAEAITFRNCISNNPVCVPVRGDLLTGQMPYLHRAMTNDLPIRPDMPSIAHVLNNSGYHTGYIGKWHLGGVPRDRYIPAEERLGFTEWKVAECNHAYDQGYYFDEENKRHEFESHECIGQTDLALEFLGRNEDKPWSLFLSWGPPHAPYENVPSEYLERYEAAAIELRANVAEEILVRTGEFTDTDRVRRDLRGYYALINLIDDQFARLRAELERTGQWENTIVVYTSDHGDMHGSQGLLKKQLPYRESVNVPLMVNWPGHTRGGWTDELIGLVDLPVSLTGLMGLNFEEDVYGRDLSGIFTDPTARGREQVLICDPIPCHQAYDRGGTEWFGVVTPQYTYARSASDAGFALFDDRADPFQQNNLIAAPEMGEIREALAGLTDAELKACGGTVQPWQDCIRNCGLVAEWNRSEERFGRNQAQL
jgi:arylsulfatase A-like enzyme